MLCLGEFRLALPREIDMLLMFQERIQGAITQAVKRHDRANKKYVIDCYNLDKTRTYLQYLDANNLYGWAMNDPKNANTWICMRKKVDDFTS